MNRLLDLHEYLPEVILSDIMVSNNNTYVICYSTPEISIEHYKLMKEEKAQNYQEDTLKKLLVALIELHNKLICFNINFSKCLASSFLIEDENSLSFSFFEINDLPKTTPDTPTLRNVGLCYLKLLYPTLDLTDSVDVDRLLLRLKKKKPVFGNSVE